MATTIKGIFIAAMKVQEVGAKGTMIRKFYIDLTGNSSFENRAEFQLMNDKCALVDSIVKGQEVEVSFNINGRKVEYANKETGEVKASFFQNLQAWKIDIIERKTAGVPTLDPNSIAKTGDDDDLPF